MKHISSVQNERVKALILLQSKAKIRKENKQFVAEGRRELLLAQQAHYEIETIFWCPDIFEETQFKQWSTVFQNNTAIVSVSLGVYQKMVMRDSTEGVVGILHQKEQHLSEWKPKNNAPLLMVVEAIEKPGNLGAILRTADAAGVDAVIVTEQHTDIYNPNVIRSSVGGFFAVPIFACTNEEAKTFLIQNSINIYAASLQKSVPYSALDYTKATAIVMGSEAKGLSPFWYSKEISAIKIPMLGRVDSLNVSVASAILIYEVVRQRNS